MHETKPLLILNKYRSIMKAALIVEVVFRFATAEELEAARSRITELVHPVIRQAD